MINLQLHQTTHWRKIKEIIRRLAKHENVNSACYNFNKITCYSIHDGDCLLGVNVRFTNTSSFSFVYDNKYDLYEVPKVTNNSRLAFEGEFLVLAHNKSFDYWLFLHMVDRVINTKEYVTYTTYGKYSISSSANRLDIEKTEYGRQITYGGRKYRNIEFDAFNTRKKAYHSSKADLLSGYNGYRNNSNTIKGGQRVKKYNRY